MPGLTPDKVQQIHDLIHERRIIEAIKLYRQATGAGLAEAKSAVEKMFQNEVAKPPSAAMDYDNPVLEGKIRSLLAQGKKIEAVQIYRDEYKVGLKAAKDAVGRVEASLKRAKTQISAQDEPVISGDPFAEDDGGSRRVAFLIAAAFAVLACAAAAFFLFVARGF